MDAAVNLEPPMFTLTVSLASLAASTTGYTADEIETAARVAWDAVSIDDLDGCHNAEIEFVTDEAATSARGSIAGDDSGADSERVREELVSRFADAFTVALAAVA